MMLQYAIVADDNHAIRQSLKALLVAVFLHPRIEEAYNGHQVLDLIAADLPDLVLMSIDMPHLNGPDTTREIKSRWPTVRVIILAIEHHHRHLALQAGADACVLKGFSSEELLQAVAQIGFEVRSLRSLKQVKAELE